MKKYSALYTMIVFIIFLTGCPSSEGGKYSAKGELDTDFNPGAGANDTIYAMAVQPDGKILLAGSFTSYNGTTRNRIARISSDGSLDTGFNPGTGVDFHIYTLALQTDGKIVIGGEFTSYNETTRNYIARINTDGSLDTSFDPGSGGFWVTTVAVQDDQKIIVGGYFTSFNGTARNRIVRLNTNGTVDTSFDPGTGINGYIDNVLIQGDGSIYAGGGFQTFNGTDRDCIVKIATDGSLDTSFDPGDGADNSIYATAVQSDDKLILGGHLTSYNNTDRNHIVRVNTNGTLDTDFDPGTGPDNYLSAIAVQTNGKLVLGGSFTSYNGTDRNYIARINTDGTLDTDFDPGTGASGYVIVIIMLDNGKLLIGGNFTSYNGTSINRIARIK